MAETPPTNMGKLMKERPILFSAPMVRAILRGEKTQTRRAVRVQPTNGWEVESPRALGKITSKHPLMGRFGVFYRRGVGTDFPETGLIPCPYGAPGDRLWVRETFIDIGTNPDRLQYTYRADGESMVADEVGWSPSIFMPRAASRITLEVTNIRVERLNDISEEDAIAEGVTRLEYTGENGGQNRFTVEHPNGWSNNQPTAKATYKMLWESINGPDTWNANPLVWAITFKQVENA